MARVKAIEYEELPPELQRLADVYTDRDASWDHLRVLAHRPEMYEAYYKFLYPLHTEGVVEPALKELVRLKIAELNQCLF
jgi:alkylhydroperoxidase family enzyme